MTMMGWYPHGSWGTGDWLLMTLSMMLVWGGVIAVALLLFRPDRRAAHPDAHTPAGGGTSTDPEVILGARFAHGEIDETEYRLRLETLRGTAVTAPAAEPSR